jgi:hypothetical protein
LHIVSRRNCLKPREQRLAFKFHVVLGLFGFKIGDVMIIHGCTFVLERRRAIANFTPPHDAVIVDDGPLHGSDNLFAIGLLVLDGAIPEFVQEFGGACGDEAGLDGVVDDGSLAPRSLQRNLMHPLRFDNSVRQLFAVSQPFGVLRVPWRMDAWNQT